MPQQAADKRELSTDVLVIGAGLAGLCAAYEAALAGRAVVIVEKQDVLGGSSALSSGFLAFAGTREQQLAGVEDNEDILLNDLRVAGAGLADEPLIQAYAHWQLAAYRWLLQLGITFNSLQLSSAQSAPRTHVFDPKLLLSTLQAQCEATGLVTFLYDAPAVRFVAPGDDDARYSVELGGKFAGLVVTARTGVVIASGGFTQNETMLRNFVPNQAKCIRYGGPGNTGDGILLACSLGADLRNMGSVRGTFGAYAYPNQGTNDDLIKLAIYKGAIMVNRAGRRFMDESSSYKILGDATLLQPDAVAYQVFDQSIMNQSDPFSGPFNFQRAADDGRIIRADSIAQLAEALGIDAAVLEATISRYNDDLAQGEDTLCGRRTLSSQYGVPVPLSTAPFYAYPSTSGIIATYGGLAVDSEARVLDVFGKPIPHLFAAGELMGGFHGASYMTGSSLGKCLIFGRIAGRAAAAATGGVAWPAPSTERIEVELTNAGGDYES